jgi:uncharacterized SAM-binding protein YcdF (DUF218 family)
VARLLLAAACVIGATWMIVTLTPALKWWLRPLSQPWDDARGDTLIILGAGAHEDGSVDYHSYLRALHAVQLLRVNGFQRIFVTGVGAAPAIRTYLIHAGVSPDRITVDTTARSTRENAEAARRAVGDAPGTKVLLTSDYHTFRAWRVFRKAGMNLKTSPAPDAGKRVNSWSERSTVFLDLCVETCKIVYYKLRGWM